MGVEAGRGREPCRRGRGWAGGPKVSSLGLESELRILGLFWVVLSTLRPQVSGDKNEEQVLNAIEAYTEHRPEITSRAINLLFDIARIERCSQLLRALKVSPSPGSRRVLLGPHPCPRGGCWTWLGHVPRVPVLPLHALTPRTLAVLPPAPPHMCLTCRSTGLVPEPWPAPLSAPQPTSALGEQGQRARPTRPCALSSHSWSSPPSSATSMTRTFR